MAKFKIESGTAKGKTWKAVGTNPVTGRQMTFQGGVKGTLLAKIIQPVKKLLMQDTMLPG